MKITISLLSLLLTLFCSCTANAGKGGKSKALIVLSDSVCDFGSVQDNGEKVSKTVSFTNPGKSTLVIQKVTTSCHCAQPTYSKAPIKAGKSGSVTITLDPKEMFPGIFQRTITVYSNAKNGPVRIYVKGVVKQ